MLIERLTQKIPTRSVEVKLFAGSILVALVIALSMVGILEAFDFPVNPAVPATVAAIGAAIFAARTRK
ncbi:MAG: hypothetical protein AB1898_24415 [Acidobacteriota bacterium]